MRSIGITGEAGLRLKEKRLHVAEVGYEIRRMAQQPRQGHVQVVHVGLHGHFAWGQFMLPHHLNPAVVILNPLNAPPDEQ